MTMFAASSRQAPKPGPAKRWIPYWQWVGRSYSRVLRPATLVTPT